MVPPALPNNDKHVHRWSFRHTNASNLRRTRGQLAGVTGNSVAPFFIEMCKLDGGGGVQCCRKYVNAQPDQHGNASVVATDSIWCHDQDIDSTHKGTMFTIGDSYLIC